MSENDENKDLREAAREYAEAWIDYRNESRKDEAVRVLENAALTFASNKLRLVRR